VRGLLGSRPLWREPAVIVFGAQRFEDVFADFPTSSASGFIPKQPNRAPLFNLAPAIYPFRSTRAG